MKEGFYVITFDSTHHAIKGEKLLKDMGIEIKMIPTPREITASCGLSIRFEPQALETVKSGIRNSELLINGIYEIIKNEAGRTSKKIN